MSLGTGTDCRQPCTATTAAAAAAVVVVVVVVAVVAVVNKRVCRCVRANVDRK